MPKTKPERARTSRSKKRSRSRAAPRPEPQEPPPQASPLRTSISIRGAREHNLRNLSLEIPRDKLVVITGVSGSGKSSLAFDTIYAEGQRRYMESLSSYAKRFIAQVAKPDVDFMFGLSPVISIEQKTIAKNPRSTVGTMTDVNSYLNLLFATVGQAHCPYCEQQIPVKTRHQILDEITQLPRGTVIELRAPIFKVYGEDLDFLFTEVRKKGYRRVLIDGKEHDLSEEQDLDERAIEQLRVIVDKLIIGPGMEREALVAIENALRVGDRFLEIAIIKTKGKTRARAFERAFGCAKHQLVLGDLDPDYLLFNNPASACRTCLGLGTYKQVHCDLLVPDRSRSIRGGCFVREAFRYNPDTWDGRIMYSLTQHYDFSLDTAFTELPEPITELLFNGTNGDKFPLLAPPEARDTEHDYFGKPFGFGGIARRIERHYKHYRQKQVAHSGMEDWLEKVMVEHRCPDCQGTRLRASRMLLTIAGKTVHQLAAMHFAELHDFLAGLSFEGPRREAGQQILREIQGRLDLLLGLDYLVLISLYFDYEGAPAWR